MDTRSGVAYSRNLFENPMRPSAFVAAGAVCAVALFAVWLRDVPLAAVEDLRPRPDALEYEHAAANLLHGDGFRLRIAGTTQPPRYPPGLSLLIAPALWGAGEAPGAGVRAVQVTAMLAVLGAGALAYSAGGLLGAVVAAAIVAGSPAHASWSKAVMSDVPAAAVAAVLALAATSDPGASMGRAIVLGLGVGLSSLLRVSLGVCLLPLVLCAGLPRRHLAAALIGVGLGVLPGLLENAHLFGSPWMTGYDYWVGEPVFDRAFALAPPPDAVQGNVAFYAGLLAGFGRLYPLGVAGAVLLGFAVATWRGGGARRLAMLALGVVLAMAAIHAPYRWQSERFVLPLLPLLAATAGVAVGPLAPAVVRVVAVAGLALGAHNLWTTPDVYAAPDRNLHEVQMLRDVAKLTPPNAAILARTSVILFERFLRPPGSDRVWLPLGEDQHLAALRSLQRVSLEDTPSGRWIARAIDMPFEPDRIAADLMRFLDAGRPVFMVAQPTGHLEFARPLDTLLRARFVITRAGAAGPFALLRLTARPAP